MAFKIFKIVNIKCKFNVTYDGSQNDSASDVGKPPVKAENIFNINSYWVGKLKN